MKLKQYMELGADSAAPAVARDHVTDALAGSNQDTVHTAALVVSELVSNAVLHGSHSGAAVGVELSVDTDHIRIEVIDVGEGFEHGPGFDRDGPGGYGLKIVQDLATSWGIDRGPPHKVWCELPVK